jgi:sugar/nucleoside kinase (ribokinase family)
MRQWVRGREISGGSAGNTAAGLAALGLDAAFIGQVADDQLGQIYRHDIEAQGIAFLVEPRGDVGATARSLILVTPDAQRTMNTFLGAAQMLETGSVDLAGGRRQRHRLSRRLSVGPAAPRAAMEAAIEAAHAAGRKVAFTLSDTFCVDRHRDSFWQLLRDGKVDILFANEAEAASWRMVNDVEEAIRRAAASVRPGRNPQRSRRHAVSGGERATSGRGDRAAGRHHRRRRPVRRRLPRRRGAGWASRPRSGWARSPPPK